MSSAIVPNCGCPDKSFFLRQKGNAVGAYCASCGKWIKWVGKNDVKSFQRRGMVIHSEDYEPPYTRQARPAKPVNLGVVEEDDIFAEVTRTSYSKPTQFAHPMGGKSSIQVSSGLYENSSKDGLVHGGNGAIQEPNPFDQATGRGQTQDSLDCSVCKYGELPKLDARVSISSFQSVLTVYDDDTDEILGSFKINYCPGCGAKL